MCPEVEELPRHLKAVGDPDGALAVAAASPTPAPLLTGEFNHKIDNKGRLVLPAGFRSSYSSGGHLQVWQGTHLTLFTDDGFRTWVADSRQRLLDRGEMSGSSLQTAIRKLSKAAERVTPDAQGRFIVPPRYRGLAPLSTEVVVIGMFDRLEIWLPEALAAEDPASEVDLAMLQDDYESHHR